MSNLIQHATVKDTYDGIPIDIGMQGKNVIITGGNGCGKTRLVERIFSHLLFRVTKVTGENLPLVDDLRWELQDYERQFRFAIEGTADWHHYKTAISGLKQRINEIENFRIDFSDGRYKEFFASYQKNESVLLFFPATRMAKIDYKKSIRPLNVIKSHREEFIDNYDFNNPQGNENKTIHFEEYLVSLKQTASMLLTEYNDRNGKLKIDNWFKKLESDLGHLFEDDTLKLNFLVKDGHFQLTQKNKEPYRFQNLSSGFSSILSIYAELMMNVEVKNIIPKELWGIAIIDEIDAHLHISLQKKILNFLTTSFPKIQFIVTTHSPFVVMSVDNAIIYDLSTKTQVEDLSAYSYASVATGLFNTTPISDIIYDKIVKLTNLFNESILNLNLIKKIINDISRHENELDEVSLLFLRNAQIKVARLALEGEV